MAIPVDISACSLRPKPTTMDSRFLVWGTRYWGNQLAIPHDALELIKTQMGLGGFYRFWLSLDDLEGQPGEINRAGLNEVIEVAKEILKYNNGHVTFSLWGTPASLSSVPLDHKDHNDRIDYFKYGPKNQDKWVLFYTEIVRTLIRVLGVDRTHFEIWGEPFRFYFRDSNEDFLSLYVATSRALSDLEETYPGLQYGGFQLSDLEDNQLGAQPYTDEPTWVSFKNFLKTCNKYGLSLDAFSYFRYTLDENDDPYTTRIVKGLEQAGYSDCLVVKNEVQPAAQIGYEGIPGYNKGVERDCQFRSAWLLPHLLQLYNRGVHHCFLDFIEDTGNIRYKDNYPIDDWPFFWGSIGHMTQVPYLIPKPAYTAVRLLNQLLPYQIDVDLSNGPLQGIGPESYILTTNPDQDMLALLVSNYQNPVELGRTYQEIMKNASFGVTIDGADTMFKGFRAYRMATIDSTKNNAWAYVMRAFDSAGEKLWNKDIDWKKNDKVAKKLAALADETIIFREIQWDNIPAQLTLEPYSLSLMLFIRNKRQ